jgi:hypothetical protein
MYYSMRVLVLTAGLAVATAAQAETALLDFEHVIGPRQEETFALIAQDLAALAPAGASLPIENIGAAQASGGMTDGPVFALAVNAGTSALDPENFLDPLQEETSALIAQDLAALVAVEDSPIEGALAAAAVGAEEPVLAAVTAELPPAAELSADAREQARNNEMETLAAIEMALPAVETTGSLSSHSKPEAFSLIPGDDYDVPAQSHLEVPSSGAVATSSIWDELTP